MKKLLSIILSAAMLATSTAFAAPIAVVTESVVEQVVSEAFAEETKQEAQLQAELSAEKNLQSAVPESLRPLKFGVTDVYSDLRNAVTNNADGSTVSANSDGTVTFNAPSAANYPALKAPVTDISLAPDRVYVFNADFEKDSIGDNAGVSGVKGIESFRPFLYGSALTDQGTAITCNNTTTFTVLDDTYTTGGQSATYGTDRFHSDKPWRTFKVTGSDAIALSHIGLVTVYSKGDAVYADLYGIGLYSKPTSEATVPTPAYSGSTAAVTYENGLHDEVKAALQVAGAIDGVTGVVISGNTVTYTIEKGKDVVIPSLVNAANDAVYPEQTLRIEIPDKHTIWFGKKVFLEDFESGKTFTPSNSSLITTAVVDRADGGKALNVQNKASGYPGVLIKKDTTTFDFANNEYSLFVEVVGMSTTAIRTRFGGDGWWSSAASEYFDDSKYIKVYDGKNYHVKKITQTSDLTDNAYSNKASNIAKAFGILVNAGTDTTRYITLDNFGIYSKPTASVSGEITKVTDIAANTVAVTFPEGVYAETADALVEYPTVIDGVIAVLQKGSTFEFTIERNKDVTIPALVNADGDATYSEVTIRIDDTDPYAVRFGKKIFFEDFETNTSFASTQSLVSATVVERTDIDGKALKISTNGGFSDFTSTITLGSETVTPDLTNYEYSFFVEVVGFNEITETNTSIIRARYGNQGTLYFNKKISNSQDNLYLNDSFETLGGKTYNVQSTETNIVLNTGVTSVAPKIMLNPYSTAGEERWMTIDNYGIYVKPKAEATATEPEYSCETNQFSITYGEGIYEAALDALLDDPTLINGVTAISKAAEGNSVTLTYTYASNVSHIELPSFINAAENKTYPAKTVEIIVVPQNVERGIRTNVENYGMGVRTVAKVNQQTRGSYGDDNVEYGTLVTLESILDAANLAAEGLTFEAQENGVNIISKASFGNGENKLHDIDGDYDFYSAAFVNIPKDKDSYKMNLVFRPYVKYTVGGVTHVAYGEPIAASPYSVATDILEASEDKTTEIAVYCQGIIDFCDGARDTLPTQA